jgi:hypothetical protein
MRTKLAINFKENERISIFEKLCNATTRKNITGESTRRYKLKKFF